VEDSQDENDFHTQVKSSYQFTVQPVDLVKLQFIRTNKINKKRARIFKEMGLPIEAEKKSHKKKIFLSKRSKVTSASIDEVADKSGNLKPFDSNLNVFNIINRMYRYIYIRVLNSFHVSFFRSKTSKK
jgi:hypothetical protein